MPVPRLKIQLSATGNLFALTTLKTALDAELNKRQHSKLQSWALTTVGADSSYVVECQFSQKSGGDAVMATLQSMPMATFNGVRTRIVYHQCSHADASVAPCVATEFSA